MRTLMTIRIEAEAGSRALESGTLRETLRRLADRVRPEASYVLCLDGMRTVVLVFDLADPAQLNALTEPLFRELKARVDMYPAVPLEDLLASLH
ncbi:hypothetical protein ACFOSC_15535 [Streptantibioticus rubrisoli]|uniref:Uncharacterized protein n=1 Tax=Streptantibioticus rubrisoli TaxID=1387313 RepID=A0ABT1PFI0_9ACTN|nr:hypothetical protein [Streptantibioticus rubrisoli]MCQ4044119.1 hypothetical protein [Streptantibioticus rubrisoli]